MGTSSSDCTTDSPIAAKIKIKQGKTLTFSQIRESEEAERSRWGSNETLTPNSIWPAMGKKGQGARRREEEQQQARESHKKTNCHYFFLSTFAIAINSTKLRGRSIEAFGRGWKISFISLFSICQTHGWVDLFSKKRRLARANCNKLSECILYTTISSYN